MTCRRWGGVLAVVIALSGCSGPTAPTPAPSPTPVPEPTPTPTPTPVPDPPSIACPADLSTSTTSAAGAAVTFAAPTTTGGESPVSVACAPASGSIFAMGATTVQCTASDARSRTASCSFTVTVTRTPQLSRTRLLAFGDSITAGEVTVPTTGISPAGAQTPAYRLVLVPSASYPTVLQSLLAARYTAQSVTVVNEGLSGERAANATSRFSQALRSSNAEVVLLLHGYNGLTEEGGVSTSEAAVSTMAAEARNRGVRVLVATLTPGKPGLRQIPDAIIRNYNDRIWNLARGEGAVLVDLYSALKGDANTYIGVDGLHPTEAGYRKMAETFLASIQGNLEVR